MRFGISGALFIRRVRQNQDRPKALPKTVYLTVQESCLYMRAMMMIKKNKKEEDCLASKTGVLGELTAGFSRVLGKTRPLASKMARKRRKRCKRGIFANKRVPESFFLCSVEAVVLDASRNCQKFGNR